MMIDKRRECGCHVDCYTGPGELLEVEGYELAQWCRAHPCTAPCEWPNCLTPDEQGQLLNELREEEAG